MSNSSTVDFEKIGKRIHNLRTEKNLTQEYTADCGIDSQILKKLKGFDDDKKERLIKIMDLI